MRVQNILSFAALTLVGCTGSNIVVSGKFVGSDAKTVYIESSAKGLGEGVIDSAILSKDGSFKFKLKQAEKQMSLYTLVYDHQSIPLLLEGGDRVEVKAMGSIINNYTVDGSDESALLQSFYQPYIKGAQQLNTIAQGYIKEAGNTDGMEQIAKDYGAEYQRIKRSQIEFIIKNKANLAAVYAIYQRLPGDDFLSNAQSDAIYYRTVVDALQESYPTSKYIDILNRDLKGLEEYQRLSQNITESTFPEIEMKDMFGEKIKLSSLKGKVILLEFWASGANNSNVHNAELKELYKKHKDQGFEIYQVSIDNSKSNWIAQVQDQKIPWISVSDNLGTSSPSLGLYNVTTLPANFVISKSGELLIRDIYNSELEDLIAHEVEK